MSSTTVASASGRPFEEAGREWQEESARRLKSGTSEGSTPNRLLRRSGPASRPFDLQRLAGRPGRCAGAYGTRGAEIPDRRRSLGLKRGHAADRELARALTARG